MSILLLKNAFTAEQAKAVQLSWRLKLIVGRPVTEIRITPIASNRDGSRRKLWAVLALSGPSREVPLPVGAAVQITALLRSTFPLAMWGRAQDYNVQSGVLVEHVIRYPACLRVTA